MVTSLGTATAHTANGHRPLPRAEDRRASHRPWCASCKRTHDAADLDRDGMCAPCARAAANRAAAAERRRLAEQQEKAAAAAAPKPPKAAPKAPPAPRPTVAPKPKRSTPRQSSGPERIPLPQQDVADAYRNGHTLAQIAAAHGVTAPTIARALDDLGIPRRRGRIVITPAIEAQVRRLYLDEGLTQAEVAARLGRSGKYVQTVMSKCGIPARPAAPRDPSDRTSALKAQLQTLAARGVDQRQIKRWAIREGLIERVKVGPPSQAVVDAYLDANPHDEADPTEAEVRRLALDLTGITRPAATDLARRLVAGQPVRMGRLTITLTEED